jgi:hypothetical protein
MKIVAWLKTLTSGNLKATWLYRRGMLRAKSHKRKLAIADYTAVAEMSKAPGRLRAMALYNRALVYYAMSKESDAIADLNQVLKLSDATRGVRTEAKRKLLRMQRNSDRTDELEPNGASRSQGRIHARTYSETAGEQSD